MAFTTLLLGCLDPLDPSQSDCEDSRLTISVIDVKSANCGIPEGEINMIATGGVGQVTYLLNNSRSQSTGNFTSLRPGTYIIEVQDSLFCSSSVTVFLNSGISFNESVYPIIQKSCAINTCHDGSGSISFNVFSNIKKSASDIKGLTQARVMPKTGSLTNDEIEQIACWVDDGALFN
ncbi:hypothetical protein [Imperialibacter sp.]|uniref:hypothetical protein n=1 Tax=Imperialibacter sp. TaxID=2038411 RepID=UPI0032F01246